MQKMWGKIDLIFTKGGVAHGYYEERCGELFSSHNNILLFLYYYIFCNVHNSYRISLALPSRAVSVSIVDGKMGVRSNLISVFSTLNSNHKQCFACSP